MAMGLAYVAAAASCCCSLTGKQAGRWTEGGWLQHDSPAAHIPMTGVELRQGSCLRLVPLYTGRQAAWRLSRTLLHPPHLARGCSGRQLADTSQEHFMGVPRHKNVFLGLHLGWEGGGG